MKIALRMRSLSPVIPFLEDPPARCFMWLVGVSLQLGSIIQSNLQGGRHEK